MSETNQTQESLEPIILLQAVFHLQTGQINIQVNKETNLLELMTIRNDLNQMIDTAQFELLKRNTETITKTDKGISEINEKIANMVEINKNLVAVLQTLINK